MKFLKSLAALAVIYTAILTAETLSDADLASTADRIIAEVKEPKDLADKLSSLDLKCARVVIYNIKSADVAASSDEKLKGKKAADFKNKDKKTILEVALEKVNAEKDKGTKVSFTTDVNGKDRKVVAFKMGEDFLVTVACDVK